MPFAIEPLDIEAIKSLLGDKEILIRQLTLHIQKLDAEIERLQADAEDNPDGQPEAD